MSIKVCGLGPAGPELISTQTRELLDTANNLYIRTNHHPAAVALEGAKSFDEIYDSNDSYEQTYQEIANTLLTAGAKEDVVYATPGSPLILEDVVTLLQSQTDIQVDVYPAMSFLDLCWDRLNVDPVKKSVSLTKIEDFDAKKFTANPILVTQVFNIDMASKLKLSYADDFEVTVLTDLGSPTETVETLSISQLDRIQPTNRTSVYIPNPGLAETTEIEELLHTISRLRSECAWDAKQTHESLIKHLEEESGEVVQAIRDRETSPTGYADLEEELGDLLLQVLLHSEIASEGNFFDFRDVITTLHAKMIRRHPHVFGDSSASTLEELEEQWAAIKETEKRKNS